MVAPKPMPASLKKARQEFDRWRKNRESPKSRIPRSLWLVAVQASTEHGNHRAAQALRLNPDYLKRQVAATRRPRKTNRSSPAFVEVTPATQLDSARAECTIELEDTSGARMRIHVKGDAWPNLVSLASSFWQESE